MKPYIAFGPRPPGKTALPGDIAIAREAAFKALRDLHGMVLRQTDQEAAIEQIAEIGSVAAGFLEGLWGSERHKDAVEAVAAHRIEFPVLATGTGVIGYAKREKMRKSLPLMGTSQQWSKAPGDESDLRRELHWFVMGVRNPNWLHVVDDDGERDVIEPPVRELLYKETGNAALKAWTRAFEGYVKTYRPELLARDGSSGKYAAIAQRSVTTYRIKDPRKAFFRFVRDQFRSVLKRPRIRK